LGICLLAENLFVAAYYLIDLTRQHVEELQLGACNLYDLCDPYSNAKLNFILPTWSDTRSAACLSSRIGIAMKE
jgi:hypothetical protein